MLSRKQFILAGISSAAALTIAGKGMTKKIKTGTPIKNTNPKKALVIWYSQTGNTRRIGRIIAATWKKQGIQVKSDDYRNVSPASLSKYDIIATGSPVYYYEVPQNFRIWIESIPDISGTPVASFVTFGGRGGNQHNTSFELLRLLTEKGGVPAGMATFGNMSTFAPTWSSGNISRILSYKHLPDTETFLRAGAYARFILENVRSGQVIDAKGRFSLNNLIKGNISIKFTKLAVTEHSINRMKCIKCGTCQKLCPVDAISPERETVDTEKCIACFACINNCPVNAVKIKFAGKYVYGYQEFLKRNNITVAEPKL